MPTLWWQVEDGIEVWPEPVDGVEIASVDDGENRNPFTEFFP
jgi:hypothetical protein